MATVCLKMMIFLCTVWVVTSLCHERPPNTTTSPAVVTTTDSPTESPSCDDVVCGLDQACHMVADGCTMCTSPQCLYSVCSTECYNCATNDSCVLMTGWCPRVPCCPYPICVPP